MSVYIKGMEMPKDGTYSIVHVYSDGHVSMPFWGKGMQIVSGITAIPVPEHGRLIDADAMIRDIERASTPSRYIKERNADMVKFLSIADAIIPADQKGEL